MQNDAVKKILHITPHLGGGVGRVLLNYLSKVKDNTSFIHRVVCLDYANQNAIEFAKKVGFFLSDKMSENKQALLDMISDSDIILIHWWNHPLLYDFLIREKLPLCRVIMWSHVSGFNPPYIFTSKIIKYPEFFVFTTPLSFNTKEIQNILIEHKKCLRAICSTAGTDHVKSIKPKKHTGFNIGYIGTVDYVKIHPNFLKMCRQVDIPNVKFFVCGGPKEKELKRESELLGLGAKFNFTGLVKNINDYLSIFDVFGYPLAPYHYGTCDQVLQESMAAGVVPIVLNNQMESYMVKDGLTGIVAKNEDEYIKALTNLYQNPDLRNYLSKNAKEFAINTFSLDKMVSEWENIYNEVLEFPKTIKKWEINKKKSEITPKDVFLESLGDYGEIFINYCEAKSDKEKRNSEEQIKDIANLPFWKAETRGTVHHYLLFFPNDRYLSIWSHLMRKGKYMLC